jgi:hypothetical protein
VACGDKMPSETIYFDKLTHKIVGEYVEENDEIENRSQAVQELVEIADHYNREEK